MLESGYRSSTTRFRETKGMHLSADSSVMKNKASLYRKPCIMTKVQLVREGVRINVKTTRVVRSTKARIGL